MDERIVALADGRRTHLVFTGVADGDLSVSSGDPALASRRAAIAPAPWTWLRQVHGIDVVVVDAAGEKAGTEADAVVTVASGAAVAVHTADCAPIAVVADDGGLAVVHAGWKGLLAGVVERAVAELDRLVGGPRAAVLGPCIHPECYEFSDFDLAALEHRFGPAARGRTSDGRPAFDLPAAVAVALGELGVPLASSSPACTACGDGWYSHRARGEAGRQALVAWIEDAGATEAGDHYPGSGRR